MAVTIVTATAFVIGSNWSRRHKVEKQPEQREDARTRRRANQQPVINQPGTGQNSHSQGRRRPANDRPIGTLAATIHIYDPKFRSGRLPRDGWWERPRPFFRPPLGADKEEATPPPPGERPLFIEARMSAGSERHHFCAQAARCSASLPRRLSRL